MRELTIDLDKISKIEADQIMKESWYALLITQNQIGTLSRYVQHDPEINPKALPYGSPKDEMTTIGETVVHILRYAILRDFDVQKCLDLGVDRLYSSDWKRVEKNDAFVKGTPVELDGFELKTLSKQGRVFLLHRNHPEFPDASIAEQMEMVKKGDIVVCEHFDSDMTVLIPIVGGIVTDHGSLKCHAAAVTRDYARKKPIPVIVETGNATKLLKHGDTIHMIMDEGWVKKV